MTRNFIHYIACTIALLQLSVASVKAQTGNRIYHLNVDKVKVFGSNGEESMAWCGGVNNPQFAMADLNQDGKTDLVIFERDMRARTFLNAGSGKYKYAPKYENNFPAVKNYIKLVDYNHDNVPDLWHFYKSGAGVCKGYYYQNELRFTECVDIRFVSPGTPGKINIGINSSDIPSMIDVDRDGDIDIVTYSQFGNLIWWYRNFEKEENLHPDSLKFFPVDKCWGKAIQFENKRKRGLEIYCNNDGRKSDEEGQNKTTSGSHSLCLVDIDGDTDYDVIDGTNTNADVQLMKNGKADLNYPRDSMISQDTLWQSNGKQLYLQNFPLAFWLDIDDDGDNDLLFSPYMTGTENYRCIHYYRNVGSNAAPSFSYQTDTLFMNEMMDVGSYAFPILYDYNKDGKTDLLVGNKGYYQNGLFTGQLAYYENASTPGQLAFKEKTKDLLNISNLSVIGTAPAIGDLDGDNLDDLVTGMENGRLSFYSNNAASATAQPIWEKIIGNLTAGGNEISVGANATPLIYDLDKDGNKDLIIGNRLGKLSYYRNLGGAVKGKPRLELVTDSLGGVKVNAYNNINGYSAPYIGKVDNSGIEYLMVGNIGGNVARYDISSINVKFPRLDSLYSDIIVAEQYATPVVGDIDGDGKYEMIIGTSLGGLLLYEQMFNLGIEDINKATGIKLYPNPAQNELQLTLPGGSIPQNAVLKIYDRMGQTIQVTSAGTNKNTLKINVTALPAGVYLCSLYIDGHASTATFIKQ